MFKRIFSCQIILCLIKIRILAEQVEYRIKIAQEFAGNKKKKMCFLLIWSLTKTSKFDYPFSTQSLNSYMLKRSCFFFYWKVLLSLSAHTISLCSFYLLATSSQTGIVSVEMCSYSHNNTYVFALTWDLNLTVPTPDSVC